MSTKSNRNSIPLHLSLTGRPLAIYPTIVPELSQRLQDAYSDRAARLSNKLWKKKAKAKAPAPVAATQPTARVALSPAATQSRQDPFIEVISITGPLLNRAEYWGDEVCIDGYDRIEAAIGRSINNPDCAGVFLDIDSPGGMVSGMIELSDKIAAWTEIKPIVAFTSNMIASAAYALACQCTEIHGQMTAMVGSVGIIYGRYDFTGMNEKEGVKIDFIKSGDQKTWGNPDTEMDAAEFTAHQEEIMEMAGWFFDRVASGRDMSSEDVAALQAGTWMAGKAMAKGLVDSVTDFDGALARLTQIIQDPAAAEADTQPAAPAPDSDVPSGQGARAPQPSTAKKETPMSKHTTARHRASLMIGLSACALIMATNMAEAEDLDKTALNLAVLAETEDEVNAMDDEDVKAMDEEDTEAMEDDEDVKAMDEDDTEATTDDDEKTAFKKSASRIAHASVGKLMAKAAKAQAAAKPAPSGNVDPLQAHKDNTKAIMALKESNGREKQASLLAAEGISVDAAQAILAATPKAKKAVNIPAVQIGQNAQDGSGGEVSAMIAAAKKKGDAFAKSGS